NPDDAAADDNHRLRDLRQVEYFVAVDDVAPVDRDLVRSGRFRSGGDDEYIGFVPGCSAAALDFDGLRVYEARGPHDQIDIVARKLRLGDIDLCFDDVLHTEREVGHG